jgi:hypothetical protein
LPGAARQPLTFFAFAKESKQRKATASRCPSGSQKSGQQSGKRNKLAFGSDKFRFFFRFAARSFGSVSSGTALPARLRHCRRGRRFVSSFPNVFVQRTHSENPH